MNAQQIVKIYLARILKVQKRVQRRLKSHNPQHLDLAKIGSFRVSWHLTFFIRYKFVLNLMIVLIYKKIR